MKDGASGDAGIRSNPLSFSPNGDFAWGHASLYYRGGYGTYWSLRSNSDIGSNFLEFYNTGLNPQYSYARGYGMAVRCVANPSPLSLILAIL